MTQYVLTILLAICALIFNIGDSFAQRAKRARTPKQSERHMLWRVQSDSTVVYVMGSVHVLPKSFYPLDTILERSLDSSDVLVLEVNLDADARNAAMAKVFIEAMLEDGKTLKDVLSKKTYALASTRVKKNGMDIALFDRFEPWVLALMLAGLDLKSSGFTGELGVDAHFSERAAAESKALDGLETIDDQIGLFNSMSLSTQEEFLKQALTGRDAASASIAKLASAWRNGDTKQLEKLAVNEMKKDTALYQKMLVDRNNAWMPKIESFLMDGSKRYLVVVGAAHLVGTDGIIAQLRARGFDPVQM